MASLNSTLAFASSPAALRPSSLGYYSFSLTSGLRSLRPRPGGRNPQRPLSIRAQTLDFSGSFFEEGGDDEGDGPSGPSAAAAAMTLEEKEEPQCPPGLRQYETMAVLRPDMTEDERLALIQRYEEVIIHASFLLILC